MTIQTASSVAGISLIMQTDDEVDQAAELLRAIGLEVVGEDGYVEVTGAGPTLSIMRGAMVEVSAHGGLLLQVEVPDVAATTAAAELAGATVALAASSDDLESSAFLQSPTGFTIQLQSAAR